MKNVIHVVCNLMAKSCWSEVCCHLGTSSRITSELAKNAHAATIDKAEHAFAATSTLIYPYRPNIMSKADFEPSEITRHR
jgi:hypothetical protein